MPNDIRFVSSSQLREILSMSRTTIDFSMLVFPGSGHVGSAAMSCRWHCLTISA